jgi:hypothetical protein
MRNFGVQSGPVLATNPSFDFLKEIQRQINGLALLLVYGGILLLCASIFILWYPLRVGSSAKLIRSQITRMCRNLRLIKPSKLAASKVARSDSVFEK